MPLVGAVLVGGRSRRMGRDKALVEVEGEPMGRRCVRALLDAGCTNVLIVGGGPAHVGLGGTLVEDPVPDGGPAVGVAGAVSAAGGPVLVLPTDLPEVDGAALEPLIRAAATRDTAHDAADVLLALVAGRRAYPIGVWRPHPVFDDPASLAGVSMDELTRALRCIEVRCEARLIDADRPEDLPRPQGRDPMPRPADGTVGRAERKGPRDT